jgi:hypothetical protein
VNECDGVGTNAQVVVVRAYLLAGTIFTGRQHQLGRGRMWYLSITGPV